MATETRQTERKQSTELTRGLVERLLELKGQRREPERQTLYPRALVLEKIQNIEYSREVYKQIIEDPTNAHHLALVRTVLKRGDCGWPPEPNYTPSIEYIMKKINLVVTELGNGARMVQYRPPQQSG